MRKRVKVANDGKCSVAIYCQECKVQYELYGLSSDQNEKLYNRDETKEHIQDIIPNVPAEWRELFVSRTCPSCWKKMFG